MKIKTRAITAGIASLVLGTVLAVPASATPSIGPDADTVAAVDSGFGSLRDLFTDNIAPWMFVIAIAIIGVVFAIRKMRQSTKG